MRVEGGERTDCGWGEGEPEGEVGFLLIWDSWRYSFRLEYTLGDRKGGLEGLGGIILYKYIYSDFKTVLSRDHSGFQFKTLYIYLYNI